MTKFATYYCIVAIQFVYNIFYKKNHSQNIPFCRFQQWKDMHTSLSSCANPQILAATAVLYHLKNSTLNTACGSTGSNCTWKVLFGTATSVCLQFYRSKQIFSTNQFFSKFLFHAEKTNLGGWHAIPLEWHPPSLNFKEFKFRKKLGKADG